VGIPTPFFDAKWRDLPLWWREVVGFGATVVRSGAKWSACEEAMSLFVGDARHTLDAKGRLIMPAKYRPDFLAGAYLSPELGGCVSIYTIEVFEQKAKSFVAKREEEGGLEASRYWAMLAAHVDVDRQGRFVVPPVLRTDSELDGEVVIIGAIDHLEIWNPERLRNRVEVPGASILKMDRHDA